MPVTFLPDHHPPLFVEIDTGAAVNTIAWSDIYDAWKTWWRADAANRKYPALFSVEGGQDDGSGGKLGITHFVLAPWRFRPAEYDHQVTIVGNYLYSPADRAVAVSTLGDYTVTLVSKVSNLVDQPAVTPLTVEQSEQLELVATAAKMGGFLSGLSATLANIGGGVLRLTAGTFGQTITVTGDMTEDGSSTTFERDDP